MKLRTRLAFLRLFGSATSRYLANRLSNIVRRALRMPARYSIYDANNNLANKVLLLHFLGIRKIRRITCDRCENEGTGFQSVLIMLAMNFCRIAAIPFAYTPLRELAHADKPMDQFVASWENALNLGRGEMQCSDTDAESIEFLHIYCSQIFAKCFLSLLYSEFSETKFEFRSRYRSQAPVDGHRPFRVGIHFRRGDVSPTANEFMWTDLNLINNTTNMVKTALDARGVDYTIFLSSQGSADAFGDMDAQIDEFLLDQDAVTSFSELVDSDILIMAKSYFSYNAALLSEGICIFQPWRTRPSPNFNLPFAQDDWIISDPDGFFDPAAFNAQLDRLLDRRKPGHC